MKSKSIKTEPVLFSNRPPGFTSIHPDTVTNTTIEAVGSPSSINYFRCNFEGFPACGKHNKLHQIENLEFLSWRSCKTISWSVVFLGVEVPIESVEDLLDLLSFYNSESPSDRVLADELYYFQDNLMDLTRKRRKDWKWVCAIMVLLWHCEGSFFNISKIGSAIWDFISGGGENSCNSHACVLIKDELA